MLDSEAWETDARGEESEAERQKRLEKEKSKELKPLFAACAEGDLAKLQALFRDKTNDEIEDALNHSYAGQAIEDQLVEIGLIDENEIKDSDDSMQNPRIPESDKWIGNTLLSLAVVKGRLDCFEFLLEKSANVDAKIKTRCDDLLGFDKDSTILHLAITPKKEASADRKKIFKQVLDKTSDIDRTDGEGLNPLHLAVIFEDEESFALLMEKGAAFDKADLKCKTPLHYAFYAAFRPLIDLSEVSDYNHARRIYFVNGLLGKGAKVDKNDPYRLNMLHVFAAVGLAEKMKLEMKQEGATQKINVGDIDGKTPAYFAATHEIEGRENPCLALLINDYHSVFRSRRAAKLSDEEYFVRSVIFASLGAAIGGGCYGYLSSGNVSTSCLTAYSGMLLPSYLFIFASTILFKVVQYIFEEVMMPSLDFIGFVSGTAPALKSVFNKIFQTCLISASEKDAGKNQNASRKVRLGDTYGDTNPSALAETCNPMAAQHHVEVIGDVELGALSVKGEGISAIVSLAGAKYGAYPSGNSVPSSAALLLYHNFGELNVKNWRFKKYRSAYKSSPEYSGDNFSRLPYAFLYLQFAWGFISFIMAAIRVDSSQSAWQQYTDFFATITHSGVPTTLYSYFRLMFIERRARQTSLPHIFAAFFFALIGPPTCTHLLTGFILYIWVQYTIVLPFLSLYGSFKILQIYYPDTRRLELPPLVLYFRDFFLDLLIRFYVVYYFQSQFNYASTFYSLPKPVSPQDYMSVITQDWALRTQTQCFLNAALQSNRGIVAFFSWF